MAFIIITLVVLTVFFIGSIFALFFKEFYIYTYGKYKLEQGSYEIAASIFDDIKGYKDADTLKMKAYYKKGMPANNNTHLNNVNIPKPPTILNGNTSGNQNKNNDDNRIKIIIIVSVCITETVNNFV